MNVNVSYNEAGRSPKSGVTFGSETQVAYPSGPPAVRPAQLSAIMLSGLV